MNAPEKAFEWWMMAVALGVFLVGGGAAALIINPKRIQEKYEKKNLYPFDTVSLPYFLLYILR